MTLPLVDDRRRTVAALQRFVGDLVNDDSFDYIVPVERKGTALVRAALRNSDAERWKRIRSSDAVETVQDPSRRARVLVLDDSVWTGRSLSHTVDKVKQALPNAQITTAAFVTHLQAPPTAVGVAYYWGVDDQCYRECREAVVEYLQAEGSLLLDTEHIEIRARITSSTAAFYEALAGWGDAVVFASANRINCTVYRRPETLTNILEQICPPYADLKSAICKIRVVSRPGERNSYSLVPICLPQLRLGPQEHFNHPHMPWTSSVFWDGTRPNSRLFHCVGLSLSIDLALDVIADLQDALPDQIEFDYAADGIDHLLAILPEIDIGQVRARLNRTYARRRPQRARRRVPDDPGIDILEELASELLLLCYDRLSYDRGFVKTITLDEILARSRLIGHPESRISAALDVLIDTARVLPEVEYRPSGPYTTVARVFGLEGEIVKRKVVRKALGLGKGLDLAVA